MINVLKTAMKIYFLTALQTSASEQFYQSLNAVAPDRSITNIKKVVGMNGNIHHPFGVDDLIILYINNVNELDQAIAKKEFLTHCRIILVLPNGNRSTIHKGLQLKPRYIDYRNGDQQVLLNVVQKISSKYYQNAVWENTQFSRSYH